MGVELRSGPAVDGLAATGRLAEITGSDRWRPESNPWRDFPTLSHALLLGHIPERVGNRHRIPSRRRPTTALSVTDTSCHDYIPESGRAAFSRQTAHGGR